MKINPDLPDEFWDHVVKGPTCWQWVGERTNKFGRFFYRGGTFIAHRIVCEGVSRGRHIKHTCKNSLCVNPEHITFRKASHHEH